LVIAILATFGVAASASAAPLAPLVKAENSTAEDQPIVLDKNEVERLGIETVPVREEKIVRRMTVMGEVKDEPAATPTSTTQATADTSTPSAPSPSDNKAANGTMPPRVLVLLDRNPDDDADDDAGEYDDEDDAEILAPGDFDEPEPLRAKRVVIGTASEPADTLYFKVRGGTQHGLTVGQRVGVKLAAPGSDTPKRIVPYSAIIYDATGNPWVFVRSKPLEFVKQHVTIEDIDHNMAILGDGPPPGTEVVTVGVAELAGARSHAQR
jgi:hypothetical protein